MHMYIYACIAGRTLEFSIKNTFIGSIPLIRTVESTQTVGIFDHTCIEGH